jgi:methylated-DNA-[protein]-cysteine S-methyltransferase
VERIAATVVASPYGPILLAVSGEGLVALAFQETEGAFRSSIERRTGGPVVDPAAADRATRRTLDRARAELEAYLGGGSDGFTVPPVLTGLRAWDRRVLEAVRRVSFGHVTSYGRVARAIGAPGAARAVGGAVGRNPVGLVVPCHRVIAGDGSLGGYGGSWPLERDAGLALKRDLLLHEGVTIPARFDGGGPDGAPEPAGR